MILALLLLLLGLQLYMLHGWRSTGEVVHQHELDEKQRSAQSLEKHAISLSRFNLSSSWAADQLDPMRRHGMSAADRSRHDLCLGWFHAHGIIVDVSWGSLPAEHRAEFDRANCSQIISEFTVANFCSKHPELYDRVWPTLDEQRATPQPDSPLTHADVIAVAVSFSTRGIVVKMTIVVEMALFTAVLPSLVDTVEPGFEYWLYLGQCIAAERRRLAVRM